jgi:hypothetical protein
MDHVITLVRAGCRIESRGGRVKLLSLSECVIHDVPTFPDTMWTSLKAQYPRLEIEIVGDRESLSGFYVHMRLNTSHRGRILLTLAVVACLAAFVAHFLM